jgi:hypothetical protein
MTPGKDPIQLAGILKPLIDNGTDVSVVEHIVLKPQIVLQDVVHQATKKGNIGARTHWRINVCQGRGAGKARVHMDDRGALGLGLHDKAKGNRVILRHVGAHNHHTVGIGEVPLRRRRRPPSEACAQTGHRGAVSDARLVFDPYHPQATSAQLLN